MGLNRESKTPCGFCFVEYFTHEHARECLKFINGTMCDDRVIRCELDGGFKQGRQFGRGISGGQIRDERRSNIDLGRGGLIQKQDAPTKKRGLTHSHHDGNKDQFGRDRERSRGAPVPDLMSSLPSARREAAPSTSLPVPSAVPVASLQRSDSRRSGGSDDDEEENRRRKNPRFREVNEDEEQDNED